MMTFQMKCDSTHCFRLASTPVASPSGTTTVVSIRLSRPPPPAATPPETEEATLPVPADVRALMVGERFAGRYYAFLLTHPLRGQKTDTYIGYATDPVAELHRHNSRRANDRTTSQVAPHWRLSRVIGPLASLGKVIKGRGLEVQEGRLSGARTQRESLLGRAAGNGGY
jgi:hypothetical protein